MAPNLTNWIPRLIGVYADDILHTHLLWKGLATPLIHLCQFQGNNSYNSFQTDCFADNLKWNEMNS